MSHPRRLPIGALLFVVVAGALALALPYATNLFATGRAFDGVSLAGQPVSGMSRAAIRDLLEQRYVDFRRAPVTIVFEGRTWTPTLDQLGVSSIHLNGGANFVENGLDSLLEFCDFLGRESVGLGLLQGLGHGFFIRHPRRTSAGDPHWGLLGSPANYRGG